MLLHDADQLRYLGRKHQRLRADIDAIRPQLADAIRAAAAAGVPQVEIVKATGYTRDRIRKIVAGGRVADHPTPNVDGE